MPSGKRTNRVVRETDKPKAMQLYYATVDTFEELPILDHRDISEFLAQQLRPLALEMELDLEAYSITATQINILFHTQMRINQTRRAVRLFSKNLNERIVKKSLAVSTLLSETIYLHQISAEGDFVRQLRKIVRGFKRFGMYKQEKDKANRVFISDKLLEKIGKNQ